MDTIYNVHIKLVFSILQPNENGKNNFVSKRNIREAKVMTDYLQDYMIIMIIRLLRLHDYL